MDVHQIDADGLLADDNVQQIEVLEELALPEAEFALLNTVAVDGGHRFPPSAVAFDAQEELLWVGNSGGHMTSHFAAGIEKYTSFQVHPCDDIRQIMTLDGGVLALTKNNLRCSTRQGLVDFTYSSESFIDMQCMVPLSAAPSSLILGGYQQSLVQLDLYELKEVREVKIMESNCAVVRATEKFLFTGDTTGKIAMRNWQTLESIQLLDAHSGSLSDFDICGTKLVTCGFSTRYGRLTCDRYLMIYDLRMLRAMQPLSMSIDPNFVRFLPAYSDSRILVASQNGNFCVTELAATSVAPFLYNIETQGTPVYAMDVSSTKQCFAFGDGAGCLHLFSDRISPAFNECSRQTEFPDPVVPPMAEIPFTDEMIPYSVIPMPFSDGRLLSDWPSRLTRVVYRKPRPIDGEVLKNLKMINFVGYATNPRKGQCQNVVPYELTSKEALKKADLFGASVSGKDDGNETNPMLKVYKKTTIKQGKEECNFKTYNATAFSGLESISPNSYLNALLQVLFHIEPLRYHVQQHLCRREFCLTCELSFLFHMLGTISDSQPVSARNFLRAFRTMPEAAALGLVLNERHDDDMHKANFASLIQGANVFLLQQIRTEMTDVKQLTTTSGSSSAGQESSAAKSDSKKPASSEETAASSAEESSSETKLSHTSETNELNDIVARLFSSAIFYTTRCKCGFEATRDDSSMVATLSMTTTSSSGNGEIRSTISAPPSSAAEFCRALERSLALEQMTHVWCDRCSKYQPSLHARRTRDLPDVLVISWPVDFGRERVAMTQKVQAIAQSGTDKPCRFGVNCLRANCFYYHPEKQEQQSVADVSAESTKSTKFSLPPKIAISVSNDGVVVVRSLENEDLTLNPGESSYDLIALVESIRYDNQNHLTSCIKAQTGWHVFNDICVTEVSSEQALLFDTDCKTPSILFYVRQSMKDQYAYDVLAPLEESVLITDESVAVMKRFASLPFVLLKPDEVPKRGDLVALDAEFVTLNQEEAELHSDGTKLTIRPSQMALARVTVVRGSGPMEGVPFIDDYISTQEDIADYVTQFSGIKPGDLNPSLTNKHLTTLKSTYLKLRYLIDNGVIFVGHGLANDFKVMNLAISSEQMLDTVQLFHLPQRRMISLRFLAWHFLGIYIQENNHDSAEDARTALQLYKKYKQLMEEGGAENFTKVMNDVYDIGRTLQWRVPTTEKR